MNISRWLVGGAIAILSACAFAQTLTTAQLATLKDAIVADAALNSQPNNADGNSIIAAAMAAPANPAVSVWRTECPTKSVLDSITWANFTPTDTADGTALYTNRVLIVQTKQFNLQTMLFGRDAIDMSRANIRAGLRDALIALPTGTGGAATSAGGASAVTVLSACTRSANRAEALFVTGPATTGTVTAQIMGFEGALTEAVVQQARNLP